MKALSMKLKFENQRESGKTNVMTFSLSYRKIKSNEIFCNPANLF